MKVAWATDLHLDLLDGERRDAFFNVLRCSGAECLLIAGDIAQSRSVADALTRLEEAFGRDIYFALGNHDYYHGSLAAGRERIRKLCRTHPRLHWLNEAGVVRLGGATALVGHDGWCDGRLGDGLGTRVEICDFLLIRELKGLGRRRLLERLAAFGDEAAAHLSRVVPDALAAAEHVVVVTHIPPFAEAACAADQADREELLPFYACRAMGDVLAGLMRRHPEKRMTVLCGHTHRGCVTEVLPNLTVRTGGAAYFRPAVQDVFDWG